MQLFSDTSFEEGFNVTGSTIDIQNIGKIIPPNKSFANPKWRLAQWGCNHNILNGKIDTLSNFSYKVSTESQTVTINDNIITLELKASKEYNGHIRKNGECWPHLLLEQMEMDNLCPKMSDIKKLLLKFNTRLIYADLKMEQPDPQLHSGHITMYFTLVDLSNNDFLWFGIQVYDARCELLPHNMAEDCGKDDASHKFIYTPSQSIFTNVPLSSKKWIQYNLDMLPYLKDAYTTAKLKGYLKNSDFDTMKITSMNFGWEMPGIYDCAIELKDLSLNAD